MDELNNQEHQIDEIVEIEELGFTDKMIGVLSEPSNLFQKLANLPFKTVDWLIPLVLVIIVAIASNFIMMNNPEVKSDIVEKQMAQFEKNFQEAVDKGQMTQEQADQQLDAIQEQMEKGGSTQLIFSSIGITVITFISFFIIAGVFLLLVKFGLKGEGDYKASMLAYGLPHYIIVLQVIVMIIAAIAMGKMFMDTSVGSFMNIEKDSMLGWLTHKLDIFSIWFYAVLSIAYAKLFKAENTTKYFIGVFGLWLGFSLIMYFVVQAVPFLKFFGL
ncbi:MAG: YIP1 family protein [Ignavibacteriae bacterium]|nr:YIP1 family protein [Ignavibacteriota bacterium]